MIDLHCHCLPGLDDGPDTLDQAEALCRAAADDGCEDVIATPHQRLDRWWNCEPTRLEAARRRLSLRLEGTINVHLGSEVRVDDNLLDDLEKRDRAGILTLAGSDYLLLEFPRTGRTLDPEDTVHELLLTGLTPVLAHPELIELLGGDLNLLRVLVDAGALVQITAMSLLGRFGRQPKSRAEAMLDLDLVHFVASDAHDTCRRPPGLSAASRYISSRWGTERAQRLTLENPSKILQAASRFGNAEPHHLQRVLQ